MSMHYRIDEQLGRVIGQAFGNVTDRQIIDGYAAITKDNDGANLSMQHLILADKQASLNEVDYTGLTQIKESLEEWGRIYPRHQTGKMAFVFTDPLHGIMVKMWAALVAANPNVGMEVRGFASENAANAWLVN